METEVAEEGEEKVKFEDKPVKEDTKKDKDEAAAD